ncbi:SDR family NAD(P)-dependent oxidoreductase [Yinghuangia seranimata]|uniref:SDR family NAD(P)-dependent oxidoreductase n=1 Tax=Yinghuangia seranimata TaxID=408067 RepID=UPI00248D3525|nr:SDR family oxidoreductase [Yinghuangia seranimata]MDI2129663.1 SDR family oxidoreductase [Yinghuangia seranimata]
MTRDDHDVTSEEPGDGGTPTMNAPQPQPPTPNPARLHDKVAVITGAGSGIGRATALRFAAEGARLVLGDLRPERTAQTVAEIHAAGGDAVAYDGDVADDAYVRALVATAVDRHGRLDVLHNNAAYSIGGRVGDITDDDWRRQQQVVLDSVFYGIRAALPHMVAQRAGSIVTTASGAGIGGEYGLGAYAAHKAAVINLTQTVAMEYAEDGVRCNAVTPGPTATEPMLAWLETVPGGAEQFGRGALLRRMSRPDEVAAVVAWLASDDAALVSGVVVQANYRVSSPRP